MDEATLERLKERARQNRRSLQGEARAILEASAAAYTKDEALRTFHGWQEHFAGRRLSDSAELIREDRDA
ncbi:MAG: hypothetical protein R3F54_26185 [Alphaproteobacteria bacterium]